MGFKRFRSATDRSNKELLILKLEKCNPAEAVCAHPWFESTEPQTIQSNQSIISNEKLVMLHNFHRVMDKVKVLHCRDCKRTTPGFEDFDDLDNIDDDHKNYLEMSTHLNGPSTIKLNKSMYEETPIWKSKSNYCIGICMECTPFNKVNEDGTLQDPDKFNTENDHLFMKDFLTEEERTENPPTDTNIINLTQLDQLREIQVPLFCCIYQSLH